MMRMPRKRGEKAEKCSLSDEQILGLVCRRPSVDTADFVLKKTDEGQSGQCANLSLLATPILYGSGMAFGSIEQKCGLLESKNRHPARTT
ncbi:hypothetical protein [Thiobacillus sp.]|uniref:hypothetical protein n=1 Tax=Thiobacillus sp. TaxID=924 RepID=UPI0017ED8DE5|nr:hypothetical protein [Thiobacillus sp.]MBC2732407.1 hypothetical protein [Thiobacillus sp.]MBC2741145.1 hypothetical protein [Thiobacillus sp.]MBC2759836.1 hypothetical protein [Thiobacillus sp.]